MDITLRGTDVSTQAQHDSLKDAEPGDGAPVEGPPQPTSGGADGLIEWFAHCREEAPVFWDETRQAWQVFRYEDYLTVSNEPTLFSSDFSPVFPVPPELALLMGPGTFGGIDPPRHGPLRKLVSQAFTPRRIAESEPRVSQVSRELIDAAMERGDIDFVSDVAYPLPVIVIAELLGIPADDRDLFREWVDVILNNEGMEYPNLPDDFAETMGPAIKEWADYLYRQIAIKREEPQDDLMSALIASEVDGRTLTDEEIVNIVALLLTAGHISSATLLSNIMIVLDSERDVLAQLRDDPSLVPGAIEEVLRYRSPFNNIFRLLTQDTEILGVPMKKGQLVVAWIASANRDPRQYESPETFDPRRTGTRHMAFGHGIHHCLGAFLARLEAKVLVEMLTSDLADFQILWDGVSYYEDDELTPKHLPLSLTSR